MKKIQFALSTMALTVALCFTSQPALAQSVSDSAPNPIAQRQPMQPNDQTTAVTTASEKTFNGTIVKSGDKLVLTAPDSKTTYQLERPTRKPRLPYSSVQHRKSQIPFQIARETHSPSHPALYSDKTLESAYSFS